uniref:Acetylornithine deacetylase/Succinyl-diaminopimelate desuccinylase n=1 Tax=Candidatus Kentrum sp. TUN TaxID=2126343 RepID=A0A451AGB3_9GAMM|nr:MAG: Acetylornithine deacetylase/Succinyl-diaminopimelate desuccinylase [Candidatus Kentron sp. TUN]VFK65085.1 MAG: Acetylornithine deacetylase/Succinyl-diaminopimelate desuccinylase [Candidatus Kentron sp. TUN]VFK67029.1 MAG: Acetylornithine deacetylase/Succinyl-diaminopimelate desuccinylase [Candidatus Kentron sp. TUN]
MKLSVLKARTFVDDLWEKHILPTLMDYIRIPNQSPSFDPEWETNGHMTRAVQLAYEWCKRHGPKDMVTRIISCPNRTPVLSLEIPGQSDGTVLLYGHLDKQPPLEKSWRDGLDPKIPVREGDKLYGRGVADDGYAVFASIAALLLLREQGIAHPRCFVLIECSEESGSPDLAYYVERLQERIGTPELIVCLDSSCGNYEQLWLTTSLRGMLGGILTVGVLEEGVHSGDASGIVPSSFRIARSLLERIEDQNTGQISSEFQVDIPKQRLREAGMVAEALGSAPFSRFPFISGTVTVSEDVLSGIINRTWMPALEITGASGLPDFRMAGNVLRPNTVFKLSLRIPPTLDAGVASQTLKKILESNPPYGAHITYEEELSVTGWQAPPFVPWLYTALQDASSAFFGNPAICYGEGFSIPFMSSLIAPFPDAQFVVTGVLGPHSNAHGPNEFLHIEMAKKVTLCVAEILARRGG